MLIRVSLTRYSNNYPNYFQLDICSRVQQQNFCGFLLAKGFRTHGQDVLKGLILQHLLRK